MWAMGGGPDAVENTAAWAVTQGTGRQVSVAAQSGHAFAKGVESIDSGAILSSTITAPATGLWYLVVRRIDWTSNTVSVVLISHTTTTTTVPTAPPTGLPTINTTPGATYDQLLAWAWVRSSDTTMVLFDLRYVAGEAIARKRMVGTLSVASGTGDGALITWDTEDGTRGITYSAGTFTCVLPGWYQFVCNASFESNSTGYRMLRVKQNSNMVRGQFVAPANGIATVVGLSGEVYMVVGDTLQFYMRQNSGSALSGADAVYTNLVLKKVR
jgi:hypothetical protein